MIIQAPPVTLTLSQEITDDGSGSDAGGSAAQGEFGRGFTYGLLWERQDPAHHDDALGDRGRH
jgi:hypothetical protein